MNNNKYKFAKKLESEEEYQDMADKLLEFAKKESTLDINTFPLSLMINPDDFITFRDQSEYFKKAYDTALRMIGARIKRLAFEGAIDKAFALQILPLYDPDYKAYIIQQKHGDEARNGTTKVITVGIPCYSGCENNKT